MVQGQKKMARRPELLSAGKNWYVLSKTVCGMSSNQYFKRSAVVSSFSEEFVQVEMGSMWQLVLTWKMWLHRWVC